MLLVSISSCASIVSDSEYKVSIKSIPTNTEFMVKDEDDNIVATGITPNVTKLEASNGYFSKANYTVEYINNGKKIQSEITPEIDGWYWANIGFGGIIGWFIVDPLTGAMYKLPKQVITDVNSLYVNNVNNSSNFTPNQSLPFNQNINLNVTVNNGEVESTTSTSEVIKDKKVN